MICASVHLDCVIVRLLAWTDSTKIWRRFRGSGHDCMQTALVTDAAKGPDVSKNARPMTSFRGVLFLIRRSRGLSG